MVRERLERLIAEGWGKGLPVVFDFDHTLMCGDIGEATLAVLTRSGRLRAERLAPLLSPSLVREGGTVLEAASPPDLTAYYEAYLAPTAHGSLDPNPQANGYVWAVEIMEGLRVWDVVRATREAYAASAPGEVRRIEVTRGQTAYPAPFFYPEMVELLGLLINGDFEVWVVSASNVWSVRWMVLHGLNPLLRQQGAKAGLAPDHVVGVATLLHDRAGGLMKDQVLVRANADYAAMDEGLLKKLRLTSRLQFPAPTYSGKVAAIWDALGQHPFLGAGDSPGDHAMLTFCEHRLWIARVDKPHYQEVTAQVRRRTGAASWIVQPTRTKEAPGFLADVAQLPQALK
jgi:hypothetical protein